MTITHATDSLPIYSAEIGNEVVQFVALSNRTDTDDVLEMDFVRECVALRQSDDEAYELVWDMVRAFAERGPVMDGLQG